MANKTSKPVTIEDARIIFRNFSGKPGQYNLTGRRTFSVVLQESIALAMKNDGWNIKPLRKRDEDEEQRYHLPIEVRFDHYPPKIIQISGHRKIPLTIDTIGMLDWADISRVDMAISPREWEPGRIKAYLKTMYVTVEEDEFEARYAELDGPLGDEDMPF